MRFFYDTEFIEDGRTIDLISIGIVAEDGREYYAVSEDIEAGLANDNTIGYRIRRHPWLMANVVPHLPLRDQDGITPALSGSNAPPNFWLDMSNGLVKRRRVIAAEVRDFLLSEPDPELWAWYGAYDHVVLCQLWGRMINLPKGIPMWTNDLKQEVMRRGNPRMPEQAEGEHNALADARHVKAMYEFLGASS